jgi:hypothetical protein
LRKTIETYGEPPFLILLNLGALGIEYMALEVDKFRGLKDAS